ncbi:MAG: hypothetical protein ACUVT5_01415 [Candidatus Bathyarchaeales archaeon]
MKQNKISLAEYLYFLSVKYTVSFDGLLKGMVLAREKSEVTLGKLSIQCRRKTTEYDMFLITNGYQVVAQFPVPRDFLDQSDRILVPKDGRLLRQFSKRDAHDNLRRIGDLRCGMKRVNVKARVLQVPKAALVFTHFGGYAHVSTASIADETGSIKLCLWNEKINEISVDSVIEIKNSSVVRFRGENQLKLGKNGQLNVIE